MFNPTSKNIFKIASQITRNYTYSSNISLKTLYPQSSLKITTVHAPQCSVPSKFNGVIPVDKLRITFSPTSADVDIRFQVGTAEWLDQDTRSKLVEKYKTKLTKDGFLIIKSDFTRSKQLNLADALEKLRTMVRRAEKIQSNPELEERKRLLKAYSERLRKRY